MEDNRELVAMQLIEAVGGADVPDEYIVPGIQASWYRKMAELLVPGIQHEQNPK